MATTFMSLPKRATVLGMNRGKPLQRHATHTARRHIGSRGKGGKPPSLCPPPANVMLACARERDCEMKMLMK
nr:MAG TPA: hypothetical protein [Caudoviricetes sp.]